MLNLSTLIFVPYKRITKVFLSNIMVPILLHLFFVTKQFRAKSVKIVKHVSTHARCVMQNVTSAALHACVMTFLPKCHLLGFIVCSIHTGNEGSNKPINILAIVRPPVREN